MKMRAPHIVPLSRQAGSLLREPHAYTGGTRLPLSELSRRETCTHPTTLNRALERMGFSGKDWYRFFRARLPWRRRPPS